MRFAARTDANHTEIVKAFRDAGCSVLSLAAIGKGVPDLLIGVPDKNAGPFTIFMVEIKNPAQPPSKQRLKPMQVDFHKEWPVFVVKTVSEVTELLA